MWWGTLVVCCEGHSIYGGGDAVSRTYKRKCTSRSPLSPPAAVCVALTTLTLSIYVQYTHTVCFVVVISHRHTFTFFVSSFNCFRPFRWLCNLFVYCFSCTEISACSYLFLRLCQIHVHYIWFTVLSSQIKFQPGIPSLLYICTYIWHTPSLWSNLICTQYTSSLYTTRHHLALVSPLVPSPFFSLFCLSPPTWQL